jgi:hypothetical protein
MKKICCKHSAYSSENGETASIVDTMGAEGVGIYWLIREHAARHGGHFAESMIVPMALIWKVKPEHISRILHEKFFLDELAKGFANLDVNKDLDTYERRANSGRTASVKRRAKIHETVDDTVHETVETPTHSYESIKSNMYSGNSPERPIYGDLFGTEDDDTSSVSSSSNSTLLDTAAPAQKPKKRKKHIYTPEFEAVHKSYGSRSGKLADFKAWEKLTSEEQAAAAAYIPTYLCDPLGGMNPQYRKGMAVYLNEHVWEGKPILAATSTDETPEETEDDKKRQAELDALLDGESE